MKYKVGDVFVAGGEPTVTYIERESDALEKPIRAYLAAGHKVLVVSGPTKSGKTVLLRRVLPREECIWIPGGEVESYEDFWARVCRSFETPSIEQEESTTSSAEESAQTYQATVKPMGIGGQASFDQSRVHSVVNSGARSYVRNPTIEGPKLLRDTKVALVVDDFHYLGEELRKRIIRSLKDVVFGGAPVIFLCIPHRVVDTVRAEPEMNGRVISVRVPPWEDEEIAKIPVVGFASMNLDPEPGLVQRLQRESFGSPFLMQELCGALCLHHEIYESKSDLFPLGAPEDWDEFFRAKAKMFESDAFSRLAQGPRTRTDRLQRALKGSRGATDLYRAILLALAESGGSLEIPYDPILRDALRDVLVDLPKVNEVTFVLNKMKEIARNVATQGVEDGGAVPVMDFDGERMRVIITDPFFAFFLRWRGADAALEQ